MCTWWKRQAKPQGGSSLAQGHWVCAGADRSTSFLPRDHRLWGQDKGWKPKSTECYMFGSSRQLGSRESTKEAEGLPSPGYPPEPLLHSAFGLGNPDQLRFVPVGSVGHLGVAWAPRGRFL